MDGLHLRKRRSFIPWLYGIIGILLIVLAFITFGDWLKPSSDHKKVPEQMDASGALQQEKPQRHNLDNQTEDNLEGSQRSEKPVTVPDDGGSDNPQPVRLKEGLTGQGTAP